MEPRKKPYRVLTIDGGGMRGLYSVTVLDTLTRRFARQMGHETLDIGKGFDLIVGTSTGGILACALALGIPAMEIINLYREDGPLIFQDPVSDKRWRWAWRNRKKPANTSTPLRTALEKHFKNITLAELYGSRGIALCIPSVDMVTHKAWVFKTPHNPEKQRDNNYRLVDVCLATSAAPIIFPIAAVEDPDDTFHHFVFADGGLWANNPVLVGMVEALAMTEGEELPIEIVSISTCAPPDGKPIAKNQVDWGIREWGFGTKPLNVALDAQASGYDFMARMLARSMKQDCKVIRLPSSPPSPDQAIHLGLDKATPDALNVLSSLGKQDGNLTHGRVLEGGNEFTILEDIIKSMPPISSSEETN